MQTRPMIAATVLAGLAGCVETQGSEPVVTLPAVGSPHDLTEFEGAKAGQAEAGIATLGFAPLRSEGTTTWYFNRATGACARIVTSAGRYSDVTMLPAEDC